MSCYPRLFLENEVKALVLCGGQSTRMGSDKGLIVNADNRTWADVVVDICNESKLDTYVSIHPSQQMSYNNRFDECILIQDMYPPIGPIGGLLSAHHRFPDSDFLILSCDMQDVDQEFVEFILSHHELLSEYDALIPFIESFYQPFPGLYSSELLSKITKLHLLDALPNYSLQQIFNTTVVYQLTVPQIHVKKLKSYNSPEDIVS